MLILSLFFRILAGLTKKTVNTVRFSIIKIRISVVFMHLQSKLSSEKCPKMGDGKIEENRVKMPALPPFFQNTTVFIEKQKTLIDFLL